MKRFVGVALLSVILMASTVSPPPRAWAEPPPLIPLSPKGQLNQQPCVVGRPCSWKPGDPAPGSSVRVWNLGYTKGDDHTPPGPRATLVEIGPLACQVGPCGVALIIESLTNEWATDARMQVTGVYQASPTLFLISTSSCYMTCILHVYALDTAPRAPARSTVTTLLATETASLKDTICGALMTFRGNHYTATAHPSTKYIASVTLSAGAHTCR